nr:CRISPR-associated ring nuclease [Rhodothermus profundi]
MGEQPQVVTLTLDLLAGRHVQFEELILFHTAPHYPALSRSLERLEAELAQWPEYRRLQVHWILFRDETGRALTDIRTEQEARQVFRTLFREVLQIKRQRRVIHLLIAGGRKVMAAYGTAVAQLLFEAEDHLWHLISEEPLLRSGRMHPEPDDPVHLVPVPFVRWSALPPAATRLAVTGDPFEAMRIHEAWLDEEVRRQRAWFLLHELTPGERMLLIALARTGASNRELAQKLGRSPKTVANQLAVITDKYRAFAGLADGVPISRAELVAHFAPVLEWIDLDSQGQPSYKISG